jgi:hypothetical protein
VKKIDNKGSASFIRCQPSEELCRELLQYIPQRPDYHLWLHVVSAVGNSFDIQTAEKILLERFTDEKVNEHRKKTTNQIEKC